MSGLSVSRVCGLARKSRQAYYRSLWSRKRSRERADEVVSLVERIRAEIPRVGVRKIYHMARERLRPLRLGRDRLFSILRANRGRMYGDERLIHHSDRGIQYCCGAYQERLRRYGMRVSMTEGHDPYANAVAERANGILKQEFLLEEYDLSLREMRRVVRDAIGTYNRDRPHYSCGYLTPDQMHRQREVEIKTYKKSGRKDLGLDKNKVVL